MVLGLRVIDGNLHYMVVYRLLGAVGPVWRRFRA